MEASFTGFGGGQTEPRSIIPEGRSVFASGRDSIRALIEVGRKKRGWRRLWVPTYFCDEVLDSIAATGIQIQRYQDSPCLAAPPPLPHSPKSADALLLVNYFGLRDSKATEVFDFGGADLIEDHTHDPWSSWAKSSRAHYCLASLRKTLPVPCGGVVWSPQNLPLPEEVPPTLARQKSVLMKLGGMVLKTLYLEGHSTAKEHYRALQLAAEEQVATGEVSGVDPIMVGMLMGMPFETWREKRRANYIFLSEALRKIPGVEILPCSPDNGACPLAVVTRFPNRAARDSLRRRLTEARVYTAVLWPLVANGRDELKEAEFLSERLIAFPCDFRYTTGDLLRVAGLVHKFLQPANGSNLSTLSQSQSASTFQSRMIAPESSTWLEFLALARHDFYHSPAFSNLSASREAGQAQAFVAQKGRNRFMVPLILKPISIGGEKSLFQDAMSPYGYPSPLLFTTDGTKPDEDFLTEALAGLASSARQHQIVSVFIRLHPLLPLPTTPLQSQGSLVQHGQTVHIDLTLPQDVLWHQTSATTRNLINVAKKSEYLIDMRQNPENIEAFSQLYSETMHRLGSAEAYHFSPDYFATLFQEMKDYFHLCLVRIGGVVAGGGIFSECRGIVQYHLSGTKTEFLKQHATRFMLDHIRTWAKERGNHLFHLGGGLGAAEDSLFKFKASFSPLRSPFYTWRLIVDREVYSSLIVSWERASCSKLGSADSYFPAYRTPFPRA